VISALERAGLTVKPSASVADPRVFETDVAYYPFTVDDGQIRFWVVDDDVSAATVAARVSPDGSTFRSQSGAVVNVSWTGRPRFFAADKIIVLYLEKQQTPNVRGATDRKVMRVLSGLMGEPFAGALGD
jgi:hypothetical protein